MSISTETLPIDPNKTAPDGQTVPISVSKIGRYEIIEQIGHGTMGIVYSAWDPYIKRKVAIKTSILSSLADREKFFVEAQSAGRLIHPNIISIFDVGETDDFCYITMEYIEGSTLQPYTKKKNRLKPEKVIDIVLKLCDALYYAQRQNVIHLDIKPANIMLTTTGIPKITDFGLAVIAKKTTQNQIFGSPAYMSPEQISGKDISFSSDIFSLGVVLYELLSGHRAFVGSDVSDLLDNIQEKDPEPILNYTPQLPKMIQNIIQRALSKTPWGRYASPLEFANDLEVMLRSLTGKVEQKELSNTINSLLHMDIFKDFSADQIKKLIFETQILKFPMGRVIVAEGDIDDTIYIILSGRVSIISKDDEFLTSLGAGNLCGELSFLDHHIRKASVITETNCIFLKMRAHILNNLPTDIQLLFFKNFAKIMVKRFSYN